MINEQHFDAEFLVVEFHYFTEVLRRKRFVELYNLSLVARRNDAIYGSNFQIWLLPRSRSTEAALSKIAHKRLGYREALAWLKDRGGFRIAKTLRLMAFILGKEGVSFRPYGGGYCLSYLWIRKFFSANRFTNTWRLGCRNSGGICR